MLSKIQMYDIWKMLFKSPPPPRSYQVVKEGGEQTNIGRGSGSIQWFLYGGGVWKGIKVVINTI